MVDRRGDEDMGFLDAAVDNTDCRRGGIRRDGSYVWKGGRGRAGRLLRQSDVFRLNDLKNVGIIEDDVLQAFPGNFEAGGKAIGKDR